MNSRHVSLIARYSARYSVRGGIGLVFLLLSLTFGLIVAHVMLQPVEMSLRQIKDRAAVERSVDDRKLTRDIHDALVDRAQPIVSWVLSKKDAEQAARGRDADADAWAAYLLEDRPAMLSAIFLILVLGWPFIVTFGAFDLYSGDIASRQLRYQLLRADRASIYVGRLLGGIVTFVAVLLLLGITVSLYMGFKLPIYDWGALLGWTVYGVAALIVVSLPYIALCAWISATVTSPFASLTFSSLVIGGVPAFATIAKNYRDEAAYVMYLLPWGFQNELFHPSLGTVLLAVGGCALMTAGFGWLGYRKFTTRDL